MVMQDLLLFASDPLVIPEDRKQIGMCIAILMIANITFAVSIMMNESLRETIRQCKMKKKQKLAVKMMKERKAAETLKKSMMAKTVEEAVPERPIIPVRED